MKNSKKIVVDGKEISEEEFESIQNDPRKKLKKTEENTYQTKQRLHG